MTSLRRGCRTIESSVPLMIIIIILIQNWEPAGPPGPQARGAGYGRRGGGALGDTGKGGVGRGWPGGDGKGGKREIREKIDKGE